jgi:hypothetical protein
MGRGRFWTGVALVVAGTGVWAVSIALVRTAAASTGFWLLGAIVCLVVGARTLLVGAARSRRMRREERETGADPQDRPRPEPDRRVLEVHYRALMRRMLLAARVPGAEVLLAQARSAAVAGAVAGDGYRLAPSWRVRATVPDGALGVVGIVPGTADGDVVSIWVLDGQLHDIELPWDDDENPVLLPSAADMLVETVASRPTATEQILVAAIRDRVTPGVVPDPPLPDVAARAITEGLESVSLVLLAGISRHTAQHDQLDLFRPAVRELGLLPSVADDVGRKRWMVLVSRVFLDGLISGREYVAALEHVDGGAIDPEVDGLADAAYAWRWPEDFHDDMDARTLEIALDVAERMVKAGAAVRVTGSERAGTWLVRLGDELAPGAALRMVDVELPEGTRGTLRLGFDDLGELRVLGVAEPLRMLPRGVGDQKGPVEG